MYRSLNLPARPVRCALVLAALIVAGGCDSCLRPGNANSWSKMYSGDGKIVDISQPSGWFGSKGYLIEFAPFDLDKPFHAVYRLEGMPEVGRSKADVRLLVDERISDSLKNSLVGRFTVDLRDHSDLPTLSMSERLRDLIWSSPIHGRRGYALYSLEHSSFAFRTKSRYTLTVDYSGDPQLSGKGGWVYILVACGGS